MTNIKFSEHQGETVTLLMDDETKIVAKIGETGDFPPSVELLEAVDTTEEGEPEELGDIEINLSDIKEAELTGEEVESNEGEDSEDEGDEESGDEFDESSGVSETETPAEVNTPRKRTTTRKPKMSPAAQKYNKFKSGLGDTIGGAAESLSITNLVQNIPTWLWIVGGIGVLYYFSQKKKTSTQGG